jgi:histidine triad (HIT) family protein
MLDCVFCKICARQIPAMVVYEDDEFMGLRDIAPKAPIHIMIFTKQHYEALHNCDPRQAGLLGRMLLVAVELARRENCVASGYRIIMNGGEAQAIRHLHLHLLGGRVFGWPPG